MITYGVIMAGGGGTRFWPLSRRQLPKQFLNLDGKDVMVNETFDRLKGLIEPENVFIVTNKAHAKITESYMQGRIKNDHILAEPAARNTAACIGYAAMEITKKYGDGIMCILASDHYIKDEETYRKVMADAIKTVEETDGLVTIGLHPTFPSTGYGYIKSNPLEGHKYRKVEEFVEKPDLETAKSYLADGGFAWNSGMFVWKASTILSYFEKLLPDIYECLLQIGEAMNTPSEKEVIDKVYPVIPKISIDYGIMERADNVYMLEGDFGWNDIGSYDTLPVLLKADEQGNISQGPNLLLDTKDCITYSDKRLIAAVGVENLVVVETDDAVLVCPRDRVQDVKKIVENLEEKGLEKYL